MSAFFQDMRGRGLGDPLLVVSDGAPGIIKAIKTCFPRSARYCSTASCGQGLQGGRLARVPGAGPCRLPGAVTARDLAADLIRTWESEFPTAVTCFQDDFEACIAHLRMPVKHRKAIRTTNLLERLFGEERRRLKVIPNAWGEKAVLKLMFAAMTRASGTWRPIGVTALPTSPPSLCPTLHRMAVSAPAATQSPWRLRSAALADEASPMKIAARFWPFGPRSGCLVTPDAPMVHFLPAPATA